MYPPAHAVDIRDMGSAPEAGQSSGGGDGGGHPRSRILAWRIPWTEEPGGLRSVGLQRVGHE